jgi:peptide subunit release factor 1 (eRF1)
MSSPREYPVDELIQVLHATPAPPSGVLSVFLDTATENPDKRAHLFAYRDGCKAIRATLPPEQNACFEDAAAMVEGFLTEAVKPGEPGVAIFASPQVGYFFAARLAQPLPRDEVVWEKEPHLVPLEALLDEQQRIVVLLLDKRRVRIFSVFLGALEEKQEFHDRVPPKGPSGGWFSLAETHYVRHHEEHVTRHLRRAGDAVLALLRRRPFQRLFLAGTDDVTAAMRRELPAPLLARLRGELRLELFAPDREVLKAAARAAVEVEHAEEKRLVAELLERGPHTVLGIDDTLDALNDGRVHDLVLAADRSAEIGVCDACGRLSPSVGPCAYCGVAMRTADLREAAAYRGSRQHAHLAFVSGEAAASLAGAGGIGGWVRYEA